MTGDKDMERIIRESVHDPRGAPTETLGTKGRALQEVTKEAVGIHVLLTRSLFGDGIPRTLLLRVSRAKPTSAPSRF